MHVSGAELALLLVATVVGAVVQGSVGFGLNLVIVPAAALVVPEALPATTLFVAVPLIAGMIVAEHRHVDWSGVGWVTTGRVPGTIAGAWLVTRLSADALSAVIGVLVVVAAVTSGLAPSISVTRRAAAAVGFTSGAMGTASSIGGPPVALLYQRHPGPVLRSTLAVTFAIGTTMSLGALAIAGEVRAWHMLLALALTPAIGVGLLVARRLRYRLDARWLRPAVLAFAIGAGLLALGRGLT